VSLPSLQSLLLTLTNLFHSIFNPKTFTISSDPTLSTPIRESYNKTKKKIDTQRKFGGSLDDGRTSSSHSHFHYQMVRRTPRNSLKRKRSLISDGRGSRTSLKSSGDDEDTLRHLLNE
jgi:hypothetical protein